MGQLKKVFIIQSLKTTDLLKSGEELNKKLSATIAGDFKSVETDEELYAQLDKIKSELKDNPGQYVLHFDCHGNKSGIGVYDKKDNLYFISWEDLRDKLREVYLASDQKLIVSFSSCEGFNVAKLVANFKPCPYYLITGSFKKIGFQDSVDGYCTFYNNFDSAKDFSANIKEVRDSYPRLDFAAFTAKQLFHIGWAGYMRLELTPERIKERKESIIADIIAIAGTITKEQENFISNQFASQASDEHYSKYREAFFQ